MRCSAPDSPDAIFEGWLFWIFSFCPFDVVVRVMDVYLMEGSKVLYRVAIAILTEWDSFKTLDYQKIYDSMQKPAFIFDGRNIVDIPALQKIGFHCWAVGKSLNTMAIS